MNISIDILIILSIVCGLSMGAPMFAQSPDPTSYVIQTPYGPQYYTQHTGDDGSQVWSMNGPGFSQTTFSSGGNPNNGFHYNAMSTGSGNAFSNGFFSGGMSGMAMGSSMGMGNMMSMGNMMGGFMQPMQPMKWWPSIFSNGNSYSQSSDHSSGFQWWPSLFSNND